MRLRLFLILAIVAAFLISGCASKGYVDEQITALKTSHEAEINNLKATSGLTADEIKKLQAMSANLNEKTELALKQSAGFENYQVIASVTINFDYDSYDLTQIAKDQLEAIGQKMIDYPRSLMEIAGYTDKSGSAKYNMMLGMQRAESVKKYTVDQFGIALYRMFTVSHGKTKPIALPDEKDASSKNRRVEIKIWGQL
ncbi:MAG: OmpA family protein [Candidatus Zixiibacteriota bacterium]